MFTGVTNWNRMFMVPLTALNLCLYKAPQPNELIFGRPSLVKISPSKNASALRAIRSEYLRRRAKNGAYSLRAFSRDLSVSASVLSEVMAEKRPVTETLMNRIVGRLGVNIEERRKLLTLVSKETKRPRSPYRRLHDEQFRLVADWYHFAILNLTMTKDFQPDQGWMAMRLGITTAEVGEAIDRLLDLGLLKWKNGNLVRTFKKLQTGSGRSAPALRLSHRQSIEQALECLEKIPIESRNITGLTIPFDLNQMSVVKDKIQKFLEDISKTADLGPNKSEVFNLNIQFVPVTKLIANLNKENGHA